MGRTPESRFVSLLTGVLFTYAAVSKSRDPFAFAEIVRTVLAPFAGPNPPAVGTVVVLTISLETLVGAALILSAFERHARRAATAMLGGFLLVLASLLLRDEPVACGCTGWSPPGLSTTQELAVSSARNLALILAIFVTDQGGTRQDTTRTTSHRRRATDAGFTLVETLAVIAVLAATISIVLPTLSGSRVRAATIRSLSGHRGLLAELTAYTAQHRDLHPYPVTSMFDPARPTDRPPLDINAQCRLWTGLLAHDDPAVTELVYPPSWDEVRANDTKRGVVTGSFVASATWFAAPSYFERRFEPRAAQLRPTRAYEIVFPSSKMMLDDLAVWPLLSDATQHRTTFGFADGSAEQIDENDLLGEWVDRPRLLITGHGHSTLHGLAGRDR